MSDQVTPPPATNPTGPGGAPQPAPGQQFAGQPAPGQPPAPGEPVPGQPVATPAKKSGVGKRILRALIIPVVLFIGVFAWRYISGAPDTANAGDCMIGQNEDDLKTIDCADATAEWKVAGKVEDVPEGQATAPETCAAYPTSTVSFWEGKEGGNGYVLCLEPLKQ